MGKKGPISDGKQVFATLNAVLAQSKFLSKHKNVLQSEKISVKIFHQQ